MISQTEMTEDFRKILLHSLSAAYKQASSSYRHALDPAEFAAVTVTALAQLTQVIIGGALFSVPRGREDMLAGELVKLLVTNIAEELPRTLRSVAEFRTAYAGPLS